MRKLLTFIALALIITNVTVAQSITEKLAKVSPDFKKYGLREGNIPEKWEDGIRTKGEKGTYEWWYFDSHLEDGSTIVIIFYTKPFVKVNSKLTPYITISINRPDGTAFKKAIFDKPENFTASTDSCNVQIGKNYFRGNLKNYEIHYQDQELNITATFERTTESWRSQTGHMVFGTDQHDYFAWVVPVPQGKTEINYTYKGDKVSLKGSCYHDHNWGNQSMTKLFNHWYWSRAEIGPYNVIASEMISETQFNKDNIVVFNVSKGGKTLADDGSAVTMYQTYGKIHPKLNKDVSDDIVFIYDSPNDEYRYEYYLYKKENIAEVDLLSSAIPSKFKLRLAKMLTSFDGAYFRMTGDAEIRVFKNNQLIETHRSHTAVWELMYFGKPNGQ